MKKSNGLLTILLFVVGTGAIPFGQYAVMAQDSNYANTPDEIFPYGNFQAPFYNHFDERLPYLGAAREYETPSDVEKVKIGFIGPLEGAGEYYTMYARQMLQGTRLALEEANEQGGLNGIPFELITRNDVGLWGASGNELVTLDDEGAIAVIGSIDGNNTHIAIRVALKLEIPVVNTGSTDPTLTETRIPWLIRTNSDDRQFNYALLNEIYNRRGYTRVAVIRANSRYARVGTKEFIAGATRLGHPVIRQMVYLPGETDFRDLLERIKAADVEAVLVWGQVDEAARIVKQMREMNMQQTVFGSERLVSDRFLELAGESAEGVVATYPYNPHAGNPELERFRQKYMERFGHEPDNQAVQAYDGTRILIEAIREAGLNRALIRDELTSIENYEGIAGEIQMDGSWNNVSQVWLAEIRDGTFEFWPYRWEYLSDN